MRRMLICFSALLLGALAATGCGDDDSDGDDGGGSQANRKGVGAECTTTDDCLADAGQSCLTNFKGGYCGVADCANDGACPAGSRCVAHDDGKTYCFLVCVDKPDCNDHRSLENEANCSSSITFVEGGKSDKACVPPSGS